MSNDYDTSPQATPVVGRERRADVALVASILASMAFTFFASWIVYILWLGNWPDSTAVMRIEVLGQALMLSIVGSLILAISFGFAINQRMVKLTRNGFEAHGGGEVTSRVTDPVLEES